MCEACIEDSRRRVLTIARLAERHPSAMPTAAELERHAQKYGPEGVAELAAEIGVRVNVKKPTAKKRSTKGPTLNERVAEYIEAGHSVDVIAELENLSPSRARRLVAEVKESV